MRSGNIKIMVIGGSAGSLHPLRTIIADLPEDLGAAVFVVRHVSQVTPSRAPEILAPGSALPVRDAEDGEAIAPGRVYFGPSDRHLVVERGRVRLRRGPKDPWNRPSINTLFRSAAAAYGGSVAGVVLSGVLSDGTAGLWEIKDAGGVTVVQSPEDARWPAMPEVALQDVPVDHCLPAAGIGPLLAGLAGPRGGWAGDGRRVRILVVEDDAIQAIDLEDQLSRLGYEVTASVGTGEEALVMAQDLPDLALVDIRLGGELDGIQTAELLRDRFKVGVVYTTSYDDDETIRRLTGTRPSGYIGKPIRSRDLRGVIEVALAGQGIAAGTRAPVR
jgi:chemotaxis response regulator CheB